MRNATTMAGLIASSLVLGSASAVLAQGVEITDSSSVTIGEEGVKKGPTSESIAGGDMTNMNSLTITEEGMPSNAKKPIAGGDITSSNSLAIREEGVKEGTVSKSIAGDDFGDSTNVAIARKPLEPGEQVLPPIQMGDGAMAPVTVTVLRAEVTGNMAKKERPRGKDALRRDTRIHGNSVTETSGITSVILTTGDFSPVNNVVSLGVGSVGQ